MYELALPHTGKPKIYFIPSRLRGPSHLLRQTLRHQYLPRPAARPCGPQRGTAWHGVRCQKGAETRTPRMCCLYNDAFARVPSGPTGVLERDCPNQFFKNTEGPMCVSPPRGAPGPIHLTGNTQVWVGGNKQSKAGSAFAHFVPTTPDIRARLVTSTSERVASTSEHWDSRATPTYPDAGKNHPEREEKRREEKRHPSVGTCLAAGTEAERWSSREQYHRALPVY